MKDSATEALSSSSDSYSSLSTGCLDDSQKLASICQGPTYLIEERGFADRPTDEGGFLFVDSEVPSFATRLKDVTEDCRA